MKRMLVVMWTLAAVITSACGAQPTEPAAGMANPAAKHCIDEGYKWESRDEAGSMVGYCLLDDGTECEEWAFYRGECGPGAETEGVGLPNPASAYCEEQGGKVEIRTEAGGEVGYCIFEDGTECDEWAYYHRDCAPGTPSP